MLRLAKAMKENKCRLTQARKEIYSLLESSGHSLTAKEVFTKLNSASSTDLVSVYRNLTLFNELGLAHKFQDGSFAICQHEEKDEDHQHIHFINHCVECGRKSEVETHNHDICQLAREIKKVSKSLKTVHEIVVQGLCPRCS